MMCKQVLKPNMNGDLSVQQFMRPGYPVVMISGRLES